MAHIFSVVSGSISTSSTSGTRRAFLLAAGAGIASLGMVALPGAAEACTVVNSCGTIVISRSGSDVIVVVKDKSGAAAVGAEVSARKGRGAFDVRKTGKLGQTTHPLKVKAGDTVDVTVDIGGCRITKSDCTLI